MFTMSMYMAVSPDSFPADVFQDLCKFADKIGVSPNRLLTGIVKERLAQGWATTPTVRATA